MDCNAGLSTLVLDSVPTERVRWPYPCALASYLRLDTVRGDLAYLSRAQNRGRSTQKTPSIDDEALRKLEFTNQRGIAGRILRIPAFSNALRCAVRFSAVIVR